MFKGERRTAQVTGVDDDGAGVTATLPCAEGELVPAGCRPTLHVPFALPGEEVVAEVEHVSPHGRGAWGRLVEVRRPSSDRVAAACRAWGRCGGCVVQHWAYERQLEWKRARLGAALGIPVAATVASPRTLGYRNRAKLVWGRDYVLGAYAPRSHDVVDLAGCAVVEAPLDEVAGALGRLGAASGLPLFDERTRAGVLRYAILRVNAAGRVLVLLVVGDEPDADARLVDLARALRAERPEVAGIVRHVNAAPGDALLRRDATGDRVLDGDDRFEEVIGGVRLEVSARVFLQVNREVAARIYADVAASVPSGARVVDVYCGVGAIALTLAPSAASVIGIEEDAAAVADARRGAPPHLRFVADDAARALAALAAGAADVVVVNPPRKGLSAPALAGCVRLAPSTLLYVSCSPASLARDLAALTSAGYRVERVTPYDMLPHTPHVEALAVLQRSNRI